MSSKLSAHERWLVIGKACSHHSLERTLLPARTLHEKMMLIAEPLIQYNWTDVAIHDKAALRSLPVGHYAYWIVTQMGSHFMPAYCKISERSKWTRSPMATLAPVQFLVERWSREVAKFGDSNDWRWIHDPVRDKHCYLVVKTHATYGEIIPITYKELADLAVCKMRQTVRGAE